MLIYVFAIGGSHDPREGTELVYYSGKHDGCLFRFDQDRKEIVHRKGKFWHPVDRTGENDTKIVLITERHDAAKFLLCDRSGEPLHPTRD